MEIVQEIAITVGRFFINPLFYVALCAAIWLGYRRVKRERKFFHIRLLGGWSELKNAVGFSVVISLVFSLLIVGIGLTVPVNFLLVISGLTIIALIFNFYHFLSAVVLYTGAFALLVLMYMNDWSYTAFSYVLAGTTYTNGIAVSVTAIVALLLIAEGILIQRDGAKFASPKVEKTARGARAIGYKSKSLWILPLVLLVPGDALATYAPWWPQFTLGAEQFSFVLFPVVIGFQQMARKTLPLYLFPALGKKVVLLGVILILGAVASYFEPLVAIIALPVALLIRFIISWTTWRKEKNQFPVVMPTDRGVMIAAVLPDSPAEKMGLLAGEVIKRVNGQDVKNESELYEALQINAAHCRLEVLDHQNEMRLTQHVVHNNDHHKIGLIII